jgi:hypothetical protein
VAAVTKQVCICPAPDILQGVAVMHRPCCAPSPPAPHSHSPRSESVLTAHTWLLHLWRVLPAQTVFVNTSQHRKLYGHVCQTSSSPVACFKCVAAAVVARGLQGITPQRWLALACRLHERAPHAASPLGVSLAEVTVGSSGSTMCSVYELLQPGTTRREGG